MNKKRCFVSFDYDNDQFLKIGLIAQAKNSDSPFEISDWSIKEASSDWREKARMRIRSSDIVIVMCGKNTNIANGIAIELEMAREENKPYFLLAGYTDGGNKKPINAKTSDKLYKWTWPILKQLIHGDR
ncbi:MAG: TIR domain-containing protein [Candidatus Pacebacteria bacterium]|nr:TIR domain-containing protein [Candidatus Paceibacterota bacterium]